MLRRQFLFLAGALNAQSRGPNVTLRMDTPPGPGARLERAYSACPSEEEAWLAVRTGMYPHAQPDAAEAMETFRAAGYQVSAGKGVWDARTTAADTLQVVTAAHGGQPGEPSEASLRVPLVFRWPGHIPDTRRVPWLASHVDILPTVLALCRIPPPPGLHGRDLSPLLLTGRGPTPEYAVSEGRLGQPGEWRAIIRGFDKMVVDGKGEITALYHLAEDSEERDNLAESRRHQRLRDELAARLDQWRKRTRDGRTASGLKKRN